MRRSRFAWLRDYAESPAPTNLLALLDRLEYVRELGIDAARARRIHPARLGRLLAESAVMTVQHIADLEPARRTAILVAQTSELEARLADATLAMFEKYIGSLFSKAQNRDERRFQATKREVAKALLLFRRTIAALKQAQHTGEDGVAVVDREVGLKRLDDALADHRRGREVADQDILVTAAERYSVLRRFSPRFLAAFRFESSVPQDPLLAAIEVLKAMDRDAARTLPKRPPASFLPPKWRKRSSPTAQPTGGCTRPRCSPRCATGCAAATFGSRAAAITALSRTTCSPPKPPGTSASIRRPIRPVT